MLLIEIMIWDNTMEYEIGYVKEHPLKYMWGACKTIWESWRYCKKNNLPYNVWYGIYVKDTELVVALLGCSKSAPQRAQAMIDGLKLNEMLTKQGCNDQTSNNS